VGSVERKGGGRGNIKIITNLKLSLVNKTIKKTLKLSQSKIQNHQKKYQNYKKINKIDK